MIFKVRKNLFETNSSSMHSIAVSREHPESEYTPNHNAELDAVSPILRRDGKLDLTLSEDVSYGWGPDILDTVPEKISYAVSSYVSNYDLEDGEADADIEFILEAISLPEVKGFRFPYRSINGRRVPFVPEIDHQSVGTLQEYLMSQRADKNLSEEEALHNFIFDPNVVVFIINDNETTEYQAGQWLHAYGIVSW